MSNHLLKLSLRAWKVTGQNHHKIVVLEHCFWPYWKPSPILLLLLPGKLLLWILLFLLVCCPTKTNAVDGTYEPRVFYHSNLSRSFCPVTLQLTTTTTRGGWISEIGLGVRHIAMGGVYYIAMEIAEGSVHSVQSVGPAKRFKWKAIEDNNTHAFDRRGKKGEEGRTALG